MVVSFDRRGFGHRGSLLATVSGRRVAPAALAALADLAALVALVALDLMALTVLY